MQTTMHQKGLMEDDNIVVDRPSLARAREAFLCATSSEREKEEKQRVGRIVYDICTFLDAYIMSNACDLARHHILSVTLRPEWRFLSHEVHTAVKFHIQQFGFNCAFGTDMVCLNSGVFKASDLGSGRSAELHIFSEC